VERQLQLKGAKNQTIAQRPETQNDPYVVVETYFLILELKQALATLEQD
jgi:hypothetical protein